MCKDNKAHVTILVNTIVSHRDSTIKVRLLNLIKIIPIPKVEIRCYRQRRRKSNEVFQSGQNANIIDSIRVFEFNFRGHNPQLLLVSLVRNSIFILER